MLLWSGQTISEIGTAITMLALPLVALTVLRASTFEVSLLVAVSALACLVGGLPAGVIVDRCRKRPVMLGCDVARAVLIGSLPVASVLGRLTLVQLYAVALLEGLLGVIFDAAYQSYVPVLLGSRRLMDGNGKISVSSSFAFVAGPSAAGFLVGLVGAALAITADAAAYIASVVSLALIRARERPPQPPPAGISLRVEIGEGLRFVLRHPLLRPLIACNATNSFFVSAINATWLLYVVRQLGWSARAAGLALGIGAVGGIAGGLIARYLVERYGPARVMVGAQLASGPGALVTPLVGRGVGGQIAVTAGFVVLLFGTSAYNTIQRTVRQAICPSALLGRMNASVRWLQWGLRTLGALLAGVLATATGLRLTLVLGAVGLGSAALWLYRSPLGTIAHPGTDYEPACSRAPAGA